MKFNQTRGLAALATIMVVLFIAMGMVMAMGGFGDSSRQHQAQDHQVRLAGQAAQAALQLAMFRLATREKWGPEDDLTRGEFDSKNRVYISVRVLDNRSGTSAVKSPDGNEVPAGQAYIRALAEVEPDKPRGVRSNYSSRGALCDGGVPTYSYGVVADRGVEVLDGSVIDAYNSEVAQYEMEPAKNANLTNGAVQLNSTSQGLRLRQSKIDGELRCLQSDQQNLATLEPGNRLRFVPTVHRIYNPKFRPPYHPEQANDSIVVSSGESRTIEPGSYRSIQVASGGTVTLDNSKAQLCQFFIKDGIKIDGTLALAKTNDNDRVQLYIGKGMSSTGAKVNFKGKPAHLSVFLVGSGNRRSGDNFILKSGTQAWMVVNNPTNRAFIIDNSHLFGALKAEFVWIQTHSAVHYDVGLRKSNNLAGLMQWEMTDVAENSSPSIVSEIRDSNPPLGTSISNYANFPPAPVVSVPGTVNEPTPPNSVPLVATSEQQPIPVSAHASFSCPTTTSTGGGAPTTTPPTTTPPTTEPPTTTPPTTEPPTTTPPTTEPPTTTPPTTEPPTTTPPTTTPPTTIPPTTTPPTTTPPVPVPSWTQVKSLYPNLIEFYPEPPSTLVIILEGPPGEQPYVVRRSLPL